MSGLRTPSPAPLPGPRTLRGASPGEASPARTPQPPHAQPRRPSARMSFASAIARRPSFVARWRAGTGDEEGGATPKGERPPIPSALQPPPEACATPLPALSMVVLSITMLGEFLSANVSAPFLLFMVEGFGQFEDEAEVGKWTGILVSTFFLTQFLTSLLWATVAAKHGARLVIGISLFGSALTCTLFGTATTIQQAMAIRLMQGVFAGAIGVARGAVPGITDQTNEGRAYAILGFSWGLGGVAGAIVGGSFENPARKWPGVFNSVPLFVKYPYLLPCMVASAVTLTGSILCLFLGPDCGPREGAIRLPPEKTSVSTIPEEESPPISPIDEEEPRGIVGTIGRKVSRKLSGIFASRVPDANIAASSSQPVPLSSTPARNRAFSRASRTGGSAYGYNGSYRARLASRGTLAGLSARRGSNAGVSLRGRRDSVANTITGEPISASFATGTDLNFAQRLLMANENTVTNIADLWVAAAMNADNEDPFESEDEGQYEDEQALVATPADEFDEGDIFGSGQTPRGDHFVRGSSASPLVRPALGSPHVSATPQRRASNATTRRPSTATALQVPIGGADSAAYTPGRRMSNSVAPIFSHVGVRTPPAVLEAQQLLALADDAEATAQDTLAPIIEGSRLSPTEATPAAPVQEPSLMSQLPLLVIFQYGVLALHSTTHDQIFYLYLVSKYPSGGLNLNAGHFSQLIALMCLAQIVYQFYFYPNIGPPRGRFSHLAMFRIGSLLYIPAYLSVVLYRVFASDKDDGNLVLMGALAISTAIRFCGITFSYTAISVLLNYMSPPHIVGFANGIAQSIVSLARFCGPVLGGVIWSVSVQDHPSGYPLGFLICAATVAVAVAHSFFIR
ncbi:major facilitator superfamily MFS-1 [Phanerochaete sordida]|uniref:Major facilitator superfamily MFS-1 n=1 Tax=Phanerochaete sordida TaxID=48140 RepID=A0A9P3LH05_9APHY|nr:major facilitator superfamily MFS-1 [Phanerochaete sordida]